MILRALHLLPLDFNIRHKYELVYSDIGKRLTHVPINLAPSKANNFITPKTYIAFLETYSVLPNNQRLLCFL